MGGWQLGKGGFPALSILTHNHLKLNKSDCDVQ